MTDLSPDARRILAQARVGQARASQALRARVKAQVERACSEAASGEAPLPAARAALTQPWILPGAFVLVVLGGLAIHAVRQPPASTPRMDRAAPSAVEIAGAEQHDNAGMASGPGVVSQSELQGALAPPPAASVAVVEPAEPLAGRPRAAESSAPPVGAEDLRGEMQMLARAEAALRDGEPKVALRVLRMHAQKYRSGQLREERDGLRLIALCALGRDPAGMLPSYIAEHNDAVLYARVREACARFTP